MTSVSFYSDKSLLVSLQKKFNVTVLTFLYFETADSCIPCIRKITRTLLK